MATTRPGAGDTPALTPFSTSGGFAPRSLRTVIWLAFAVRLAVFPFADNKHGDSPVRALIAGRMNADPVAAADPRTFCQFGPLPIVVLRPFLALGGDTPVSSRVPSLITGMLVFLPFFALGRRMVGGGAALSLAGLALALSPLHIQASTTAVSEGLYLLLLLLMFVCLHAAVSERRRRDFILAGLFGSLAAVTRYDTLLALPVAAVAALAFGARDRRALVDVGLFLCLSGVFPVAYLSWSWMKSGDPFFFARYISRDHAIMGAAATARLGGGLARARQVGVWTASFAAAMTPAVLLGAFVPAGGWRRWSAGTRVVLAAALAPPAAYLAKGLLFGDFEPLPRFAIAPGVVLLPLGASGLLALAKGWPQRRIGALVAGSAFALSAIVSVLAFARPGRIWGGAESMGPLTRLDAEDRALADALRGQRRVDEGVFVDTIDFADIAISHAARVPASRTATLGITRTPGPTLAASRATTAASWFAIHDDSWGRRPVPDWPPDSQRFGHWRLVYFDGTRFVASR